MSAPQSLQERMFITNQLGAQGFMQHPKFSAWFYRSKCFITPFWLRQYEDKNVVCLEASQRQLQLTPRHEIQFFLLPPCPVVATTFAF